MQELEENLDDVIQVAYDNVNKNDKNQNGGDSTLEWYGTTGRSVKRGKRKKGCF